MTRTSPKAIPRPFTKASGRRDHHCVEDGSPLIRPEEVIQIPKPTGPRGNLRAPGIPEACLRHSFSVQLTSWRERGEGGKW